MAVTAAITLLRLGGTVDSDVAWQLWIAERIHAGANLYTDIIETNPPLWFWMAVPIERISAILHLRIEAVLVVAIGIAILLSLGATNRLIGNIPSARRWFVLCYAALAMGAIPWMHVGQREQIVLIVTVPYAALVAARRRHSDVTPFFGAAVGVGAALGFALKQYFLLVPIALEIWLVVELGRRWRPFRPEIIAIATVGAAYAVALALLEPDYLFRIVPLIRLAYGVFGATSARYMFGAFAVVGLLLLGALLTQSRTLVTGDAPFAGALTIASLAFAAIYFIQFKGWLYHSIPLIGCASIGLAAVLAANRTSSVFKVAASVLLAFPLLLSAVEVQHSDGLSPDLANAVAGLRPGEAVGFLTTETAIPWSVTLQGHYRYASRYMGFWMIRAINRNELLGNPDQRLKALGQQIVAETVEDFTCIPPRRIIVTRPRYGEDTLDMLPFFLRDPKFSALLAHYRARSRTSLETYELVTPLPRPTFACRNGV